MQKILKTLMAVCLLSSTSTFASLVSETTTKMPIAENEAGEAEADPLYSFNKAITHFNEIFDGIVMAPVVGLYNILAPNTVKEKIHNVMHNLGTPYTLINDVLQGEGQRASESFARFMANSTFGIAGLFDVADKYLYLSPHTEDFGQTLAVWGADDGCYLVLPILGPSTLRDTLGLGVGIFLDPMNYILYKADGTNLVKARSAITAFDRRVRSDEVIRYINKSADPYKTARILYLQNREFEIKNGKVDQESPAPEDM